MIQYSKPWTYIFCNILDIDLSNTNLADSNLHHILILSILVHKFNIENLQATFLSESDTIQVCSDSKHMTALYMFSLHSSNPPCKIAMMPSSHELLLFQLLYDLLLVNYLLSVYTTIIHLHLPGVSSCSSCSSLRFSAIRSILLRYNC